MGNFLQKHEGAFIAVMILAIAIFWTWYAIAVPPNNYTEEECIEDHQRMGMGDRPYP